MTQTRKEHRAEILGKIEALKNEPASEARDLRIRLLAAERDRVDDWQILDHYQYRNEKLRESLLGYLELEFGKKRAPEELAEIEADHRTEDHPVPPCRHCGKSPLEAPRYLFPARDAQGRPDLSKVIAVRIDQTEIECSHRSVMSDMTRRWCYECGKDLS